MDVEADAAFIRLVRRAAAIELARAAADYQPSSADDASAARKLVVDALESVIDAAGDVGDDAAFTALSALRSAVARDLAVRGARLAGLRAFVFGAPLPALTLADRLYDDASRADELARQADPAHPLFMPVSFKALSS
ncbi:hypothetical protein [Phenylobacterium sp.]|uniref:hypothetical protein n=1 Tax=Phenylobacterium sp. TaxID=1871053 RepID=UPI0035B23CB4